MGKLTPQQLDFLRSLKTLDDDDTVRFKEIIKQKLIESDMLMYLLNNKELVEADADNSDYIGVNIFPYFVYTPTIHNVMNLLCFDVEQKEEYRHPKTVKVCYIRFYILCDDKTGIEKSTGIARHDLIAAMIKRIFNWSNMFGKQIRLVSDIPSVTDTDYATRTLTFEGEFPNNIVQSYEDSKTTRVINKIRI